MSRLTLLILPLLLAGCAASPDRPANEQDPWEGMNRKVYAFNDAFDRHLLKPVSQGYKAITPDPVEQSVTNFFSNLDDLTVVFNDLLQGKFGQAAMDFSRFTWNTTVGIGGLFDVASHMQLPKHEEDFGQTLGAWGLEPGPYVVLPFLGPSTLRDTAGLPVDWYSDPLWLGIEDQTTYWSAYALRTVDKRAGLLRASRIMDQAALDPYAFMRDAYLQQRRSLVYDGEPPMEDDFFDDMFFEE